MKLTPVADPIKLFFSTFSFFGVKLGHFTINQFFLYVTIYASLSARVFFAAFFYFQFGGRIFIII